MGLMPGTRDVCTHASIDRSPAPIARLGAFGAETYWVEPSKTNDPCTCPVGSVTGGMTSVPGSPGSARFGVRLALAMSSGHHARNPAGAATHPEVQGPPHGCPSPR